MLLGLCILGSFIVGAVSGLLVFFYLVAIGEYIVVDLEDMTVLGKKDLVVEVIIGSTKFYPKAKGVKDIDSHGLDEEDLEDHK
jgi:hypothetical protein